MRKAGSPEDSTSVNTVCRRQISQCVIMTGRFVQPTAEYITLSGSSSDSGFDTEFASLCAFPIFSIDFTVLVLKAQNL